MRILLDNYLKLPTCLLIFEHKSDSDPILSNHDIPERTEHCCMAWKPLRNVKHYPNYDKPSRAEGFHPEDPGEKFCRKETTNTGSNRKTNPGIMSTWNYLWFSLYERT